MIKYLAILALLALSACGPRAGQPYAPPAYAPPIMGTCHGPVTGGICTGAYF